MRLRESTNCTGRALAVRWTVDGTYRYLRSQASPGDKREDDLDDGAVEELLFGWFEGGNEDGKKQRFCH
jgi:hypothetical protein